MSKLSKISWLISGLSLLVLIAVRFILGGWANFLFVPLALLALSVGFALVMDWKFYLEFFTLRTTKHGMNMGVLIILVIALLTAMNMLSVRFNKTADLTSEGLNSLSEQTVKVLNELSADLKILVFYRGIQDNESKVQMKDQLSMYQEASNKVNVQYIDAYTQHGLAQKYLSDAKGESGLVVFFEYQGNKIRAQQPLQEEQLTSALIKATRTEKKKIYFLIGHGEKSFSNSANEDEGLGELKKGLEDSSFIVEEINLLEKAELPSDAKILAIVGPTQQITDREMDILRGFAKNGGRFFIAADPGTRSNIAQLTKSFGVEFLNNFLINELNFLAQRDAGEALGVVFDSSSEITRGFRSGQNFTAFPLASQVRGAPDAPPGLVKKELVKTNEATYGVLDISKPGKPSTERQPFSVAVSVEGALPGSTETDSEGDPKVKESSSNFASVVFGDSDFLVNGWIVQGINRDLALNAFAYLAKEADLISIRPKKAEGTKLVMSSTTRVIFVIGGLLIPLFLLISSGVIWFKRRGA